MDRAPSAKVYVPKILEADIRDASLRVAKRLGVYHKRMHFGPGAARGWPDDLFLIGLGQHWWVEFKRPGATATDLQLKIHADMRARGCDVSVIDHALTFENELRRRLKWLAAT